MAQNDDFQERLNRIRLQRESLAPRSAAPPTGAAQAVSKGRDLATNALYPLSLVGAFLLGLLAVFIGRYVRFQLINGADVEHATDVDMVITAALGLGVSFVLSQMFRLTSKDYLSMQSAGIFVAICTFHNLFHWMPGPMSAAFSPAYVQAMQQVAPANTAIFRGMVLNLIEREEPAPALAESPVADDMPGMVAPPAAKPALPGRLKMDSEKTE